MLVHSRSRLRPVKQVHLTAGQQRKTLHPLHSSTWLSVPSLDGARPPSPFIVCHRHLSLIIRRHSTLDALDDFSHQFKTVTSIESWNTRTFSSITSITLMSICPPALYSPSASKRTPSSRRLLLPVVKSSLPPRISHHVYGTPLLSSVRRRRVQSTRTSIAVSNRRVGRNGLLD